jgi:aspartyl-tRNA(Asn)/glutamyl-tRNA(Gln) amidotransferase subunit B
MSWKLTVGMEIHVELETKTKMFCSCKNDPFHSEPNTNVCPVCYGLPGALPLANKEAIAMVARFGQAINAEIPTETFWARKNYFYPDLPKGYQISQSALPLVQGGVITIDGEQYHLDHAHLEEDAGKLTHSSDKTHSLVDYNRAGVPLLEIVTKPEFHSAEAAKKFCQELQRIMRSLKISSADMEKGYMRCEANISVSKTDEFGTKVEVKNINSFRSVERAINYEFERQTKALDAGESLVQETRTWNDQTGETVSMRTKETSADYRYFPEPDLPRVSIELAEQSNHLLPEQQRDELTAIGLSKDMIQAVLDKGGYKLVIDLAAKNNELAIDAAKLLLAFPEFGDRELEYQELLVTKKKELGLANDVIKTLTAESRDTNELRQQLGAIEKEVGDIDFNLIAHEVIVSFPGQVQEYKSGKEAVLNFLVGQAMAKTKGRANIQQVRHALLEELAK